VKGGAGADASERRRKATGPARRETRGRIGFGHGHTRWSDFASEGEGGLGGDDHLPATSRLIPSRSRCFVASAVSSPSFLGNET